MSCINNTTKTKQKQYHHLTENDRAKIQSLVEQKDEKRQGRTIQLDSSFFLLRLL